MEKLKYNNNHDQINSILGRPSLASEQTYTEWQEQRVVVVSWYVWCPPPSPEAPSHVGQIDHDLDHLLDPNLTL